MVSDTAIANGSAAHRAKHRVCVASGSVAALAAGERDNAAFNRVLAGWVHFRHKAKIAAEFFGWHGADYTPG